MRRIILSPVACLAVQYFFHIVLNGTIFEKSLLYIKCLFRLSLQLLSETFLILRRNERDMIKNIHRSSCEVPVIHVIF